MSYLVQARLDDHTLSANTGTAKEAFAKAIEWQVRERFNDVHHKPWCQYLFD